MNEQELEDFYEFLGKKGVIVESFMSEFKKVQDESENISLALFGHEKDMNSYMNEINLLREQVAASKRVVDESLSSQDAIKMQIENFQNRIRDAAIREMSNKNDMKDYEDKKSELLSSLEVGSDWQDFQIEERDNLEKERDFLNQKLEAKMVELNNLRSDIDHLIELVQEEEKLSTDLDEKCDIINNKLADLISKTAEATRKKGSMEKLIFDLRKEILQIEVEMAEKQRIMKGEELILNEKQAGLENAKAKIEEHVHAYDKLENKIANTTFELNRQKKANSKLQIENQERLDYCNLRNEESKRNFKEVKKFKELTELVIVKIEEIEKEKMASETLKDELEKKIQHIQEVDIKSTRKENEAYQNQISSLKREFEIVKKKQMTSDKAAIAATEIIAINENAKKNLLLEKVLIENEIVEDKAKIQILMQEKEKFENEAELANQRYYTALEEIKLQDLQIKELQAKISEEQNKLKQKQNLYDTVRSDRNLYSKQLIEIQEEITAFKRKFRGMNHLIEQLKDEISSKDHAIVKEHFNHHAVDKEKELLKNEIAKVKKQLFTSDEIVENQRIEVLKLMKIIDEGEKERVRQKHEVMAIESEKNLLMDQMMKRNSELKSLYEKIKLMRSNLFIGETQYNRILESIGHWQLQIRKLVEDNNDAILALTGYEELRKNKVQLEKEIRIEQTKSSALYEELQHPMNIHRWRILESSDPQRFERIKQIQELQKELIQKAEEVVQSDLLIQEKEKVYVELKQIIARQPGPEVEEQLLVYQQTLKDKNKQLAAMDDELDMYRQQVSFFKEEIIESDKTMDKLKKKWLKIKKQNFNPKKQ